MILLVEPLLNLLGDKIMNVAVAAQAALDAIMTVLNPDAVNLVLPALLTSNDKWQANEARLRFIIALSKTAKVPLSKQLDTTIPVIVHDIHDLKEQVSAAAKQALLALCVCCSNKNIEPFIPGLMTAMEFPSRALRWCTSWPRLSSSRRLMARRCL
jgi:elongation factor 3